MDYVFRSKDSEDSILHRPSFLPNCRVVQLEDGICGHSTAKVALEADSAWRDSEELRPRYRAGLGAVLLSGAAANCGQTVSYSTTLRMLFYANMLEA